MHLPRITKFMVVQAHSTQLNIVIHSHYQSTAMLVLMTVDAQDIIAVIFFIHFAFPYQAQLLYINTHSIVQIMWFGVQAYFKLWRCSFFSYYTFMCAPLYHIRLFTYLYFFVTLSRFFFIVSFACSTFVWVSSWWFVIALLVELYNPAFFRLTGFCPRSENITLRIKRNMDQQKVL